MVNSKKMYFVNILMDFLPNSGFQGIKAKLMRWAGVKVGKGVQFFQGVKIQGIGEVEIGNHVFIGHEVLMLINKGSKIIFEDNSGIGTRGTIATGFHVLNSNYTSLCTTEGTCSTIIFRRGSGTGTGCLIMPNSELGEMSFVAAGTVVNKRVKPYSMIGPQAAKTYLKEGRVKSIKG